MPRGTPGGQDISGQRIFEDRARLRQETYIRLEYSQSPPFEGMKNSPDVSVLYRRRCGDNRRDRNRPMDFTGNHTRR
jgi:hypothetical protein